MNIDYYNDLVKSVEQGILVLLEQSRDSDLEQDIKSVKNDVDQLWADIKGYGKGGDDSFRYTYIEIDFNREYELSLPKYGVEVFDRKLKGLMYFNILGGNNHYIDIQTNSFPETFRIRLRYKTLDTISNQTGKAFLLYKRGSEKLKGKEENIEFKIKKIR
jgi:hypothetical protein|tara:strand:- start:47 stop:526 length:480 start_codon:yes stop_codon:yes gene_type:complete